jgi:hypothetical protein
MSKRYPGNFITGNPVALSQTSNTGVWDLKDNYQATSNGTWQEVDGVYEIGRSLRFRASASAYLSRTPATAGNRKTWTYSVWCKRTPGAYQNILSAGYGAVTPWFILQFENNDLLQFGVTAGSTAGTYTTQVFRDPSAWYHIVFVFDTTQAVAIDRMKLYVNGSRVTSFSSIGGQPSQNTDYQVNNTTIHHIGYGAWYYDGYLAEANFVDGQALDPSYFGYIDSITGIWQPKKYTGTYGTNGFYLPFNENGSLPNLGRNRAGSNLVQYSEQIDNAWWSKQYITITADTTTAPDGTTTADKIVETVTTGEHLLYATARSAAAEVVTFSGYLKAAERTTAEIGFSNFSTGSVFGAIDLTTGAVYKGTDYGEYSILSFTSTNVGNGWYRFAFTVNKTGAVYSNYAYIDTLNVTGAQIASSGTWSHSFAGTAGSGIYAWGLQINYGVGADPYIKTTSSAANNDWTTNNFSLTAGATYDSMVDSPTNVFTTATDIGGVVSGNYCTLNPVGRAYGGNSNYGTFSNANLSFATSANPSHAYGTMAIPSTSSVGFYWEGVCTSMDNSRTYIGLVDPHAAIAVSSDGASYQWPYKALLSRDGTYFNYASGTTGGTAGTYTAYVANDTIMVAYKNGSIWFGKNGTWMNSGNPAAGTGAVDTGIDITKTWLPYIGYNSNWTVNFGQRPFIYTPPAGFVSLNTTNMQALGTSVTPNTAIVPNKWMDINQYGGTGSTGVNKIVNKAGFAPDLVWLKSQDRAYDHDLFDTIRGPNAHLETNATNAEYVESPSNTLISFNSDGFSLLGDNGGLGSVNNTGWKYIGYQWKQSPAAGFNIVSYLGDNSNNRSISHNLGVAPAFIMVKSRGNAFNWDVYHKSLGIGATMTMANDSSRNASAFGSTAPTSSNFYTQYNYTNSAYNYIAYVWAEVPGFSKFGSYIANASADGPFIYTGFKPKFVWIKASGMTQEWVLLDSTRSTSNGSNPANLYFTTNSTAGEGTGDDVDFLSNGFKIRVSGSGVNYNSGQTYIYCAWAENPFALNNRAK